MGSRTTIALAAALPAEFSGIRRLGNFKRIRLDGLSYLKGDVHGVDAALFVSGMGEVHAYETAKRACAGLKPRAYVSVGLSAALKPELVPGDVVVGIKTAPLGRQGDKGFPSDRELVRLSMAALAGYGSCTFGLLVVSDRVLISAQEKRAVANTGLELALDMESSGAARAAHEAGVPFLAIRAISDTLDEDLPVDFNQFTKGGGMDWPRFILHVLMHPAVIPRLIRLGRNSRLAARNLAGAVERVVLSVK